MSAFRFVFDQHINARALKQLRSKGIDVVHVADVGLSEADDADIFAWSIGQDRIIVTRNYRDLAPLVEAYNHRSVDFPGVLFYATSVRHSDAGHHVLALEAWIRRAHEAGHNPAANGIDWLR